MQRQQHVLDNILDIHSAQESPVSSHDAPYPRRNFLQQLSVGTGITRLSGLHQIGKTPILSCRLYHSHHKDITWSRSGSPKAVYGDTVSVTDVVRLEPLNAPPKSSNQCEQSTS